MIAQAFHIPIFFNVGKSQSSIVLYRLSVLLSIVKACVNLLFCCSFPIKHYALVLILIAKIES